MICQSRKSIPNDESKDLGGRHDWLSSWTSLRLEERWLFLFLIRLNDLFIIAAGN